MYWFSIKKELQQNEMFLQRKSLIRVRNTTQCIFVKNEFEHWDLIPLCLYSFTSVHVKLLKFENPPLGCALALAERNLWLCSGRMVRHFCHGLSISTHPSLVLQLFKSYYNLSLPYVRPPSPRLFMDRQVPNLVGRSGAHANRTLSGWFPWQPNCFQGSRLKRSHCSHTGRRWMILAIHNMIGHTKFSAENEQNLQSGFRDSPLATTWQPESDWGSGGMDHAVVAWRHAVFQGDVTPIYRDVFGAKFQFPSPQSIHEKV